MSLVSVIVPVYNGERWIKPCADSILAQTLSDFELIFVDDASTDKTPALLAEYSADMRVHVLRHKTNRFAGEARNTGMCAASGKYLLFLDADDFFEPTLLEEAVCAAERDYADVTLFGANLYDGKAFRSDPYLLVPELLPKHRPFYRTDVPDKLFQLCTPEPWTKLFRRSFVEAEHLRFQPLQNTNDLYFTLTALAAAGRITAVEKVLAHHRTRTVGSVQACRGKEPLAFLTALEALRDELCRRDLYGLLEKSYANLALFHCIYNCDAPADWPSIFAELGVKDRPESDFYIPGDFSRYIEMTAAAGFFPDDVRYGRDFWREAWRLASARADRAEKEIESIRASSAYRLGRAATWLPRKLRGNK